MTEMTARGILNAIREGLEETAFLAALGYDATQMRPGRLWLNDALERLGYGRPINEQEFDRLAPYQPYPEEWMRAITAAVSDDPDATLRDVTAALRSGPADTRS